VTDPGYGEGTVEEGRREESREREGKSWVRTGRKVRIAAADRAGW